METYGVSGMVPQMTLTASGFGKQDFCSNIHLSKI
jgi:hypothetical protein